MILQKIYNCTFNMVFSDEDSKTNYYIRQFFFYDPVKNQLLSGVSVFCVTNL